MTGVQSCALPIFPNTRLRIKANPVEAIDETLNQKVDDMFETMYEAPGIELAATQVDYHYRLLVADVSADKNEPWVLINPVERKSVV